MSVIISGNLAYDYIMDYPGRFREQIMPENLHILNVSFEVQSLRRGWGGTGGNIAYNLRLLGAEPVLVSALGRDGGEYLERLRALGIGTDHVCRDAERMTSSCHITTDLDDNQITAFHQGAAGASGQVRINDIEGKASLALISPSGREVMLAHLKQCAEAGIPAAFDPGQTSTKFSAGDLRQAAGWATFLLGNDYEMRLFCRRTGWDKAQLLRRVRVLVTTLGKEGCLIETAAGESFRVSACPPERVLDPTGAGDAFRAGFFAGYERGRGWEDCARLGAAVASFAIEAVGTQEHRFTPAELAARYQAGYGDTLELW